VRQAPRLLEHADRAAASRAAADLLARGLRADLARCDQASLVVSGGSTPGACFECLAAAQLDWARVVVAPSDERWVPADHVDSNEGLVRRRLLRQQAAAARLLPFYRSGLRPEQAAAHIEADLATIRQPFSAVLLGMGEDGHFASLFPDFEGLSEALDPTGPAASVLVRTAASPHPRISLTLAALHDTPCPVLLFFGAKKRPVFEAARAGDERYPVAALLHRCTATISAIWAP
jgi:6-phosphogluconolactonase